MSRHCTRTPISPLQAVGIDASFPIIEDLAATVNATGTNRRTLSRRSKARATGVALRPRARQAWHATASTTSAGARATNDSLPSLARKRADLPLEVGQALALLRPLGLLIDQALERQDDLGLGQDRDGALGRSVDRRDDRHRLGRQQAAQERLALSQPLARPSPGRR